MTCPESRAGQWQLTRKALVATRSLAFWWGLFLFGAQWGREGEEDPSSARARASPTVDAASSLRVLLGRHPPADRKADEPFPYPEDSSPATGSESNFSSQNIPAAKSHSQTSQKKKKNTSPHAQNLMLQTQVFSLGLNTLTAFAVCFCTNINYLNHTRWQSTFQTRYRSLVWFLCMLWYTTPVLTKARTHFVCWCSHLWH